MRTGTVMAVTGDVGAGKSTVSKLFEELGGVLIDADRLVADLWRLPDMIAAASNRWGDGVLDESGRVVHVAVAKIIFADRQEYDWATSLLHPRAKKEIQARIDRLDLSKTWVVAEIPLLFEAGVDPRVTAKIFVTASRKIRLDRCRARGWDEAELTKRETFFMDSEKRMALSDFVIRNDGTLEELRPAVKAIYMKEVCDGRCS